MSKSRAPIQAPTQITGDFQTDKSVEMKYRILKSDYSEKLFGYFERYKTNKIDLNQLREAWTAVIKDFFPQAFQMGMERGKSQFTYGKYDKTWVEGMIKEELNLIENFLQEIKTNFELPSHELGILSFVNNLDGIEINGLFESLPDKIKIYWELNENGENIEGKNCEDCVELAKNSPYTKASLPCLPRDCSTKCNSSCLCRLRLEVLLEPIKTPIGRETVTIDKELKAKVKEQINLNRPIPKGYSRPSPEDKAKLDNYFSDIDTLKYKISIETDPEVKRQLIKQRQKLNGEAIDYAEKKKIYYVRSC